MADVHLTDLERRWLWQAGWHADMEPTHKAVERIIAARLTEQREAIRVALVQQADVALVARNQYAVAGLGFAASAFGERAETWEAAATIVREYQPGDDT